MARNKAKPNRKKARSSSGNAGTNRSKIDITSLTPAETGKQLAKMSRSALLSFESARLNGKSFVSRAVRNKHFEDWLVMAFKRKLWPFKEVLEHQVSLINSTSLKFELRDYFRYLISHYELNAAVASKKDNDVGLYELLEMVFEQLRGEGNIVNLAVELNKDDPPYEPGHEDEVFTIKCDHERAVKGADVVGNLPVYTVGDPQRFVDLCFDKGILPLLINETSSNGIKSARFMVYPMNISTDSPISIPTCRYIIPTVLRS